MSRLRVAFVSFHTSPGDTPGVAAVHDDDGALGRQAASHRPSAGNAHLLSEYRSDRQLMPVDVTGDPQPWHHCERRSKHRILPKHSRNSLRVSVEVEQLADPFHSGREIT